MRGLLVSLSVLGLVACADKGGGGNTDDSGVIDDTNAPSGVDADEDGYTAEDGDCDDADAAVNPDAEEICDGADNDCDALVDDEDDSVTGQETFYADADADSYGSDVEVLACAPGPDVAAAAGDCDDADAGVNPDAEEICDGADNDCDSLVDDEDDSVTGQGTYYADEDGDGFGDEDEGVLACEQPADTAAVAGDCRDNEAAINPDAEETCDAADNDCDGQIDDQDDSVADQDTWYDDNDGDGFGDAAAPVLACVKPPGASEEAGDCDDADDLVYPGADETCDGIDEDCDGSVDEDAIDEGTFYPDDDLDGYGDGASGAVSCDAPPGYLADGSDCDDADPDINPGETEVYYDGIDADCDGGSDDDADGDGYDSADYGGDDCDDADASVSPGAKEDCLDGIDGDCDGVADEEETCDSCADYAVIAYNDSGVITALETAAAGLGMTITTATAESTFTSSYGAATWDIIVSEVAANYVPTGVQSALSAHISAGGLVISSYWDLDGNPSLQAMLGVSVVRSIDPPMPLYPGVGSLWSVYESLPTPISYSDVWADNGDVISPLVSGTSQALGYFDSAGAETSILSTFSGQVLVMGFLPSDYQYADGDGDGVLDMVELYTNELITLTGCTP